MTIFKSNGMQWRHVFTLGNIVKRELKTIGYWFPENRILKENLLILHDSDKLLVLFSEKQKQSINLKTINQQAQ